MLKEKENVIVQKKNHVLGLRCTSSNSQTSLFSSSVNRVCSHAAVVGREGMKVRKRYIQSICD